MERFNKFLYGFIPGLLLPVIFIWIYLSVVYPIEGVSVFEVVKQLFPGVMMGKILLLSIVPNLIGVFIFYKQDSFKLGIGMMVGALPYLSSAMFMM